MLTLCVVTQIRLVIQLAALLKSQRIIFNRLKTHSNTKTATQLLINSQRTDATTIKVHTSPCGEVFSGFYLYLLPFYFIIPYTLPIDFTVNVSLNVYMVYATFCVGHYSKHNKC